MTFTRLLPTAALLAALAAPVALAESHADKAALAAVKARQAHMQLYAHNLGVLGGMARGNAEYDAGAAQAAAANLAALSQLNQMSYWMPGTSNAELEETRALPAIWEDGSDIGAKSQGLVEAAMQMEAAAGEGLESLQGAMQALGGACGACHKVYREADN